MANSFDFWRHYERVYDIAEIPRFNGTIRSFQPSADSTISGPMVSFQSILAFNVRVGTCVVVTRVEAFTYSNTAHTPAQSVFEAGTVIQFITQATVSTPSRFVMPTGSANGQTNSDMILVFNQGEFANLQLLDVAVVGSYGVNSRCYAWICPAGVFQNFNNIQTLFTN